MTVEHTVLVVTFMLICFSNNRIAISCYSVTSVIFLVLQKHLFFILILIKWYTITRIYNRLVGT